MIPAHAELMKKLQAHRDKITEARDRVTELRMRATQARSLEELAPLKEELFELSEEVKAIEQELQELFWTYPESMKALVDAKVIEVAVDGTISMGSEVTR